MRYLAVVVAVENSGFCFCSSLLSSCSIDAAVMYLIEEVHRIDSYTSPPVTLSPPEPGHRRINGQPGRTVIHTHGHVKTDRCRRRQCHTAVSV